MLKKEEMTKEKDAACKEKLILNNKNGDIKDFLLAF
jgi:hypothetical protein